LAAAIGAAATIVLVSRGNGGKAALTPTPPESIQGPHVRIGQLTYAITEIRILKLNRPADAPYLVNLQDPPKGDAYFGVFLKIYNHDRDNDHVSAPGFLLEPTKNTSLTAMNQSSESPYRLDQGGTVPAGSELPVPGSASAGGPIPGGMLLYVLNGKMTAAQPFRLVIHTGAQNAFIFLPRVPNLAGGGH
jgi:hypothetical protein